MKSQHIRTKASMGPLEISGRLHDKHGTYLWFGYKGKVIGILDGQKMYRLAKAIVRHYEGKA